MSSNEEDWLTFWASSASDSSEPLSAGSTSVRLGKHSGHNFRSEANDFIGYIVIETGYNDIFEVASVSSNHYSATTGGDPLVVLSPSGIVYPYWPVILNTTPSIDFFSDSDNRINMTNTIAVISLNGSHTIYPPNPCSTYKTQCDCTRSFCAWCTGRSGYCFPSDMPTKMYCSNNLLGTWIDTTASCDPTPSPVPSTPSPVPSQPVPQSPTVPTVQPPPITPCTARDVCECLTTCSWCRAPADSGCMLDSPSNEVTCKSKDGIWVETGSACGPNVTEVISASHSLSALGNQASEGSALITLILGCLILMVAFVIFAIIIIRGIQKKTKKTRENNRRI